MSHLYVPFDEISEIGFHINSVIALSGLIISLWMFVHVLSEWKCGKYTMNTPQNKNDKLKLNSSVINSAILVMFLSLFLFVIYTMEFFFLRIFPPTKYNYNSFTFCKNFTPFLFISPLLLTYMIMHYFLIRLQNVFKGSIYAYPTYLFIIIRIITVFAIICPLIVVFIATIGLPYNIKQQTVTNDNPWLCRNGIYQKWPNFWNMMNIMGLFFSLSGNFLCWYLFMHRLVKLIKLGLTYDHQFISFYSSRNTKNKPSIYTQVPQSGDDIEMKNEPSPQSKTPIHKCSTSLSATNSIHEFVQKTKTKIKENEINRIKRKKQRQRKELILYALIKKQSILTGIVSITGAIFWTIQIVLDEGSSSVLCDVIINVICVYLSFAFKKKCFNLCCGKCENCTCIEDHIEKNLAKKMGLDSKSHMQSGEIDDSDSEQDKP